MIYGSMMLSGGFANENLLRFSAEDIGITGFTEYRFFGNTVWLTTTHISLILIMLAILVFAVIANRAIKKADPHKVPGPFLNVIEYMVEAIDGLTVSNMGEEHGRKFSNYIGTIFMFILLSNISGLFGLRSPTADYGVTLALGLMTFFIIHYNGMKYERIGHITKLFKPIFLTPINIIGEIATPLSMSLRLFGNVLSGTVLLGLVYGLLPEIGLLIWPAFLHGYFDVFSGAIQTYVFCMLTMVFTAQTFGED